MLFDGDKIGPEKMDLVVALCATLTDTSIIAPDGSVPQNVVVLTELSRTDLVTTLNALGHKLSSSQT